MTQEQLMLVYQRLFKAYGAQHWWPADSIEEIIIGAVLTQNTAWTNVEKAINNLKLANCLSMQHLHEFDVEQLATHIRPSGYFNVKARRLKNLAEWFLNEGGISGLKRLDTESLRVSLLSVNGVGPETADDILLYAFERPVFVIDAYTRRLLSKLKLIQGDEPYEALRGKIEAALAPDVSLFNEYHALIVRHAKEKCKEAEGCSHCLVETAL